MKTPEILKANDPNAIARAQEILLDDGLIVFPTDTLYGLACLHDSTAALTRIYTSKHRSSAKAIPVLIGNLDQLSKIAENIPNKALKLIDAFWPGKLTLVLPKKDALPELLSPFEGIAVRFPAHPFAQKLLQVTGPLAVTSANISDHQNHADVAEILAEIGNEIDLLIDGGSLQSTTPSTIVDCTQDPPVILRAGAIPEADVLREIQ